MAAEAIGEAEMTGGEALLYSFQEALHVIQHPKPRPQPRIASGDRDPLKPRVKTIRSCEFKYVVVTRPSRRLHYPAGVIDEERSHWTLVHGGLYEIPLAQFENGEDCDDDLVDAVARMFVDDEQKRQIVYVRIRREQDKVVFSFEEKQR